MEVMVLYADRDDNGVWFDQVANVNVPVYLRNEGRSEIDYALEYVYRACQNIYGSWSRGKFVEVDGKMVSNEDYNQRVQVVKPLRSMKVGRDEIELGHRSMMVGDRAIIDGVIYEVSSFGFKKVEA